LSDVTRRVKQKRKFHSLHSVHYESIIAVRTNECTHLLKSQYYNTSPSKRFGPHSPFISEHTHSLPPRCYNPCRVLADSRSRLQLSLSLALQFLNPNFSASFVTPSIHLMFGRPARLLPSGLSKVIFLHGR